MVETKMRSLNWKQRGSVTKVLGVPTIPFYDCSVKLIDEKRLIYFLDCTCWNFVNRRIKHKGVFSDKKFYSEPCKHLQPIVEALMKQGYTLKAPKPMTGNDYCNAALRRTIMERSGGMCEMPIWSGPCPYKLHEIHRKIPATNGGKYNEDNCIGLCKEHHKIVTFQKWHGSPGTKSKINQKGGKKCLDSKRK